MEIKISVLIITKNSQEILAECIESVKDLASEVIVADGGSTDNTSQVARESGARFFETKFKNFADQRNFALSLAGNNWIFYLDSDERATPSFISELKEKIGRSGEETAGFYIRRKTFFLGKDWGFTDRVQRIFKKSKLKGWYGVVHETPKVDGKLEMINEPVLHFTHRNLESMIEKTNDWSEYEADLRFKAAHPRMGILRFLRIMLTGFLKSYLGQKGWKNGTAGLIESLYQSFSMFVTYAKLWERQQKN
jgi:glycosyltransferase involved in cell wall biosynthesis